MQYSECSEESLLLAANGDTGRGAVGVDGEREGSVSELGRAGADLRAVRTGSFSSIMNTAGVYGIAVLFLALGALLQATGAIGNFLSPQNMLNIVDAVALVGIVAVGMAFVTYSGNYADMSVPTTMGFTGYICIELLRYGFGVAILGALAVGLLIGLFNGLVVGRFKANPIIWTLAVNYVTMGVIRLVWVNKQIYPDMVGSQQHAVTLFDGIYRLRFFNLDRPAPRHAPRAGRRGPVRADPDLLRRQAEAHGILAAGGQALRASPSSARSSCPSSLPPSPRRLPASR